MRDCDTKCETKAVFAVMKWIGIIAVVAAFIWAYLT